MIDIVIKR